MNNVRGTRDTQYSARVARYTPLIFLLLSLLSACTSLESATSIEDHIIYTRATLSGLTQTAINNLRAGAITSEDAQYIRDVVGPGMEAVDLAEVAIGVGNTRAAEGKLLLATSFIRRAQDKLREKGIKP